jgi:hypothetical protein
VRSPAGEDVPAARPLASHLPAVNGESSRPDRVYPGQVFSALPFERYEDDRGLPLTPDPVRILRSAVGVEPEVAMPTADAGHEPTTTPSVVAFTSSDPLAHANQGGWTLQRLQVLNDASGMCARCGMAGADTAIRGWAEEHLVAAHTRCVVGLGPPPVGQDRAA